MTKALVLDFDGVVVRGSEAYKQDAFHEVLSAYGDSYRSHFEEASACGGDRYDLIYTTLTALAIPEADIDRLVNESADSFDTIVQRRVVEEGILPDERQALEELSKQFPLYLNSFTPSDALRRTVVALEAAAYFKDSLGRPRTKVENLEEIARRENASPEEIIFVGDGPGDAQAAQHFGCHFIGFANAWNQWDERQPFALIRSLAELRSLVEA